MRTPTNKTSQDLIERIVRDFADGGGYQRVASRHGVGVSTVQRHVRAHRRLVDDIRAARPSPAAPAPPPEADPVVEAQRRLEQRRRLEAERELVFDLAGEKSLREHLGRLVRETADAFPPPPPYRPPAAPGRASVETVLLTFSDWHAYEIVKKERTQGMNEYNAAVFARRMWRIVGESISIKTRMEDGGGFLFPDLVVSCNGDFVSGTIHEVEKHTDAPHIVAAVYGCARTLALALRDLAAHYQNVTVVCTSGNHGRLPDHRKVASKEPTRNWDTLIYLFAEAFLADVRHVRFLIPESYACSFNIGRKRFVQYHGHGIKSWNQIPHYGIMRWTRNNQALRSKSGEPVDVYLISHFHSDATMPASGGKTFVNGSVIGGTEYSIDDLGACDPPSQNMYLVSDPIGVNSKWELFGEVAGEKSLGTYPVYPWIREG